MSKTGSSARLAGGLPLSTQLPIHSLEAGVSRPESVSLQSPLSKAVVE